MHPPVARPEILALESSKIREVANAGLGREDLLAFWFGESDLATPEFIAQAAAKAVLEGRTKYTHNLGRLDLREALSAYLGRLHGKPVGVERLAIASAGVSGLMLAAQAVVSPGDTVAIVTPIWPNIAQIPRILSAKVRDVPLEAVQGRWRLDVDRLIEALTPDVRAVVINSPNNPTGWTLPAEDRQAILDHCRKLGIWLIADDVYERVAFGPSGTAPSFLPLAEPDDRLISVNSFSKAWRMTGWRMGWIVAPQPLVDSLGTLIEYNTSCAPDFIQSAAIAALNEGEDEIAYFRNDLIAARDRVLPRLRAMKGIEAPEPDGGMYAFFRIDGCTDSVAVAKRLVAEAGLGLAPGAAFGPQGEGWLRWCFAARPAKLDAGLDRLEAWLANSN
jgi:aspartate aminotransferase